MTKFIAVLNVIAWSGFWAFGYLALTTPAEDSGRMVTALAMAALGAALGLWAWFRLVRHSERTGYARPPQQVRQGQRNGAGAA